KNCVLKLHGNDPLLNVVSVGVKQVKGISSIEVDVPPGAVLVANFPTLKAALLRKVEVRATNGMSANRLFWNIPKGRAFAFNRTKFYGTFIAPRANVALSRNEGSGAFWVENLAARKSAW